MASPTDKASTFLNMALEHAFPKDYDPTLHQLDYQTRDNEVVDYDMYELKQKPGFRFRGPAADPDGDAPFFSCVGAAQTFGCYVQRIYPHILSDKLGMPALNLALGTAGPRFYAASQELIDLINKSEFLVVQVMSGRSEPNSRFTAVGSIEVLHDKIHDDNVSSAHAWTRIRKEEPGEVERYIAETRRSWIENHRSFLARVKVPTVLLWLSSRQMDPSVDLDAPTVSEFMGLFPQFIDRKSFDEVAAMCDVAIESYSDRNANHQLISRFTGKPAIVDFSVLNPEMKGVVETHNAYYPSPEMHEDAAELLLAALEKLKLPSRARLKADH
jgi:hypothetical protein